MRVEWPVLFTSHALGQTIMRVIWELSDQFCSNIMDSVKRAWEFYESWVTSFVQLSCTRSNEHESCMRVEWPVLFNSHVLGQTSMTVVWELSDQLCSTLLYSVKRAWKLYESWVTSFVQLSCTRSNDNESSTLCMRVEWPLLFNSHVLGQTSMRVVWGLSDHFCSTLMH